MTSSDLWEQRLCVCKRPMLETWIIHPGISAGFFGCCIFFLFIWVGNWGFLSIRVYTFILDNMILYEKKISVLIVIADPE